MAFRSTAFSSELRHDGFAQLHAADLRVTWRRHVPTGCDAGQWLKKLWKLSTVGSHNQWFASPRT